MVVGFVVKSVPFYFFVVNRVAIVKLPEPLGLDITVKSAPLEAAEAQWLGCLFVCCVLCFSTNSYVENQRERYVPT